MATVNKLPEPDDVILGRYQIVKQIGRGGFGVVFQAVQIGMQRSVALKMLLPSAMVHQDMVERFRREAVLARNLNHPNTIRLYDFGQTEEGLLFIAMEYLEGRPLDWVFRDDGPLPIERVQRIGVQILKSLAEAHQHGIIHRDIKPSNIFVLDNVVGEPDFVKVLDFGIAKALGESQNSRLTQTGMGFGTPYYMAPEQVRAKDLAPATDLYALGLLMTEMLTGKTVYSGESSMDVAVQQLSEEAPPIPEWVLRGPMGPVLQRATQKDIHLRYPSAVEMLRDLRGIDPHASIDVSAKINTRDLPAVNKPRLPVFVAMVSVVFLLLVGIGVGGAILYNLVIKKDAPPVAKVETDPPEKKGAEDGKAPTPESDKAPEPDKAVEKIVVNVVTEPSGASVFHGEEKLGESPVELSFDASKDGMILRIELAGHTEHLLEVELDKDRKYKIELKTEEPVAEPEPVPKDTRAAAGKKAPPVANKGKTPPKDGGKPPVKGSDKGGAKPPTKGVTKKPPTKGKDTGSSKPAPKDIKIPRL